MPRFSSQIMSIFAPLLIYASAVGTLCGSIVLAGAMLLAAPPSASVATDGKAAAVPAKLVRAGDRAAVPPARIKAEIAPAPLVTPAASTASPAPGEQKSGKQQRAAAPAKKPIAHSRPHQQPGQALGYAAAPDVPPSVLGRGQ
jgi:hypothetical protein